MSKGVTERLPVVQSLAAEIAETLPGTYGALCIQIFHDPLTNESRVIEINPRFGGGYPLSWEAGARFPIWMIEELLGRSSMIQPDSWRDRLVMLRYDDAVFVDAEVVGAEVP